MAVRRRLGDFANLLLKEHLAKKRAEYESSLIGQRQKELSEYNYGQDILKNVLTNPDFARRLRQADPTRQIGGLGVETFIPTQEEELGGAAKEIESADTLAKLPSLPGLGARYPRLDQEQLAQIVAARNDVIKGGAAPVKQSTVLPTGAKQDQFINPWDQPGPFPTELGVGEQGALADQAKLASLDTTGDALAGQAGAEAGARAEATFPFDLAIAKARAEIEAANRPPTEAQTRAAGLFGPMGAAHTQALELENKGVGLNLGTQTAGNIPLLNRMIGQDQRLYLNDAQGFLNFATLILTGVTARPDEYARYTGTLFALDGDDPTTRAQKQSLRTKFLESVATQATKGIQYKTVDEMMAGLGVPPTEPVDPAAELRNKLRNELRSGQ